MTMDQFEVLDALSNRTRPAAGKRELAEMTEEELEEELRGLMQAMRPGKRPATPTIDWSAFDAHHEKLARVFDPTGKHARAMEANGDSRRSSGSRRLNYLSIIYSCVPLQ